MLGTIRQFQTISRHEEKLRQSPVVIECLTAVLNYIKSVLTDDSTQALIDLINSHIESEGHIHHENFDLFSRQIIQTLQKAYIGIGLYTNEEITERQFLYFFRDIYDGYERYNDVKAVQLSSEYDDGIVIPKDYDKFVKWLISNPQIYIDELPEGYDEFNAGLSIKVASDLFEEHHNSRIDAHSNSLSAKIDDLMKRCSVLPVFTVLPISFSTSYYRLVDITAFNNLMTIISNRLAASGNPLTIDYTSHTDTVEDLITFGYDQTLLIISDFFNEMYTLLDDDYQVAIIQYDIDSLEAIYFGGTDSMIGYKELLEACGETDDRVFKKKYTDYYLNHLTYVLSDTMTLEYRNSLSTLRGNVHTNYSKVYNVFTLLNQNNFSVYLSFSLSHLITDKTLDIINVVGLTKSIACLTLIPEGLTNRLEISFDNYNPAFTQVLITDIKVNEIRHISVVISFSKTKINVHIELNDNYAKYSFDNINRMFDVFPFFLYAVPRVADYLNGTNRITTLKLFSKALSDEDSVAALAGFSQ